VVTFSKQVTLARVDTLASFVVRNADVTPPGPPQGVLVPGW
jgi:hypothetical protein